MPIAITLRLDPLAAAAVKDMWRILAEAGIATDRHDLGYPPHITLAIYPDEVADNAVQAAFVRVTAQWRALPVKLGGLGIFPAPSSILWAAPVVTAELCACHAMVCEDKADLPIHPQYRQGAWMPHVTLSGAIEDPERAIAVLRPGWQPVAGFLDQVELVRFHPVEVLRSRHLPSHAGTG